MSGWPLGGLLAVALGAGALGAFAIGYLYGGVRPATELIARFAYDVPLKTHPLDLSLKTADITAFAAKAKAASAWAAAKPPTLETLPEREKSLQELRQLSDRLLEQAELSVMGVGYERAREMVELVQEGTALMADSLESLLPTAAGRAQAAPEGELVVQVAEKPFGMHVEVGSTIIKETFPGFPAQRLGLQPGCKVLSIGGVAVAAGTWVEAFQRTPLPFELRLDCSQHMNAKSGQRMPSQDPKRFRAVVVKKPFGMNVQVNVLPRVVEVLPGFPAEAAGVKKGFVLTEVNDVPVGPNDWFAPFQNTELPFTLTFDTTVPMHKGNPFMDSGGVAANKTLKSVPPRSLPRLPAGSFAEFSCEVSVMPFGMQVRAPLGGWPVVMGVVPNGPAEAQGVREGDVLVEVAGRAVDVSTWFAAFQQASLPFGLRFQRPQTAEAATAASVVPPAGAPSD